MKQLIIISSPEKEPDEAATINDLFEAGLSTFHLRKPGYQIEDLLLLLQGIRSEYYSRIVLPATLLDSKVSEWINCKQFHYFEYLRMTTTTKAFEYLQKRSIVLSTSVHNSESYHRLHDAFNYTFLSPVFDSISKEGYQAINQRELLVLSRKSDIKLIGLGGIQEANCVPALEYGFDGLALLGAIWKSKSPITAFEKIQKKTAQYS